MTDASRLVGAAMRGMDPGWTQQPCYRCGKDTRFPGHIAELVSVDVPAICDQCASGDIREAYQEHDDTRIAEIIERAELPDLPRHKLDMDVSDFLHGDLIRRDKTPARGMICYGETGSGKSTQLVNLARAWISRHRCEVLYRTEGMLFERLKNWDDHAAELHRLRTAPLLIIDDLGTHKYGKDWAFGMFFEVVDARYANGLRTVFATNLLLTVDQAERAAARNCGTCKGSGCKECRALRENTLEDVPHIDERVFRRICDICHPVKMDRRAS